MSNASNALRHETPPQVPLGRAVVPMLAAAGAVTLALLVAHVHPSDAPPAAALETAQPTPYSEAHRQVEESPGEPEPLPPTF